MSNKELNEIFSKEDIDKLLNVGFDIKEENREGSFILVDKDLIKSTFKSSGVEILPLKEALNKYEELKNYIWKIVDKDKDAYTRLVYSKAQDMGFFIRSLPNSKPIFPVQTCFLIKQAGLTQTVHNIIIAEENSELNLINGCAAATYGNKGSHIAVSEFYVKRNAKITFTMIHDWAPNVVVRPRTSAIVDENGVFLSNYVSLKTVKSVQASPTVYLAGKNSKAKLYSILYAIENTNLDIGGTIYIEGENSSGEILSRVISNGGKIISRGKLVGLGKNTKAHMECNGIILKDSGDIITIPELETKIKDVEMSHEAIVGKLKKSEIEYLMSRGIKEEDAVSLILRGFLNIKIENLPQILQKSIDNAIEIAFKGL